MKAYKALLFSILMIPLCAISIYSFSQDNDSDAIHDQLEQALVQKFAPEWRFHQEAPGDGSIQNETELFYPASMEWFYNRVVEVWGQPPRLNYNGNEVALPGFEQLDATIVPGTSITASDPIWGNCGNESLKLVYPESALKLTNSLFPNLRGIKFEQVGLATKTVAASAKPAFKKQHHEKTGWHLGIFSAAQQPFRTGTGRQDLL